MPISVKRVQDGKARISTTDSENLSDEQKKKLEKAFEDAVKSELGDELAWLQGGFSKGSALA
ncbi:MAG: hypothetical protein WBA67_09800 [Jannaschia sp.]